MQIINLAEIKTRCSTCSLHEICLPRGLSRDDLKKLEDVTLKSKPVKRNEVIYRSGDKFTSIFAVNSGSFKITLLDDEGDEQIIGFYLPGEIFGFDGIEKHKYSCTATALETSSLCSFPYENLTEICRSIPQLHEEMLRIMSREISFENQLLITINKKTAEERVATFLLSLSTRFKRLGYSAFEFKLSMSRQDIGNYLGLTVETISRIMNKFQKEGLLKLDKKFVKIVNHASLQEICTTESDSAA